MVLSYPGQKINITIVNKLFKKIANVRSSYELLILSGWVIMEIIKSYELLILRCWVILEIIQELSSFAICIDIMNILNDYFGKTNYHAN